MNGPDGNLWILEGAANKIAKVTTAGVFTEYPTPGSLTNPSGIGGGVVGLTVGPDANLWFTEPTVNKVVRVTTSGVFTEFPMTTAASLPQGITSGPDGNLWVTERDANKIAQVTTVRCPSPSSRSRRGQRRPRHHARGPMAACGSPSTTRTRSGP